MLRLRLAMTQWEMSLQDSTCGIAIYNLAQSGFRYLSLRGANEMSNFVFRLVIARGVSLVAIHNPKSRLFLLDSLFDLLKVHYYRLPRKFYKLARNDISHCVIARRTQVATKQYHFAKGGFCAREQISTLQKTHRLKKEFKQRK